ncbi:MAG TPA: hypothetical protein VHC49_23505 [Mycobacteriales bacterium]|nr:hypothetical protein [Mycobacteriales bacterium]
MAERFAGPVVRELRPFVIEAAFSTLITGAEQPRVRDDGTW